MTPLIRLDWSLFNAREDYKKAMTRATAKFTQYMNAVSLYPAERPHVRNRVILHAKTKGLITMDREQHNAYRMLTLAKTMAQREYEDSLKPEPPKSAWFGGEYDERTYY